MTFSFELKAYAAIALATEAEDALRDLRLAIVEQKAAE